MSILLNPNVEPAVNATVTIDSLPVEVTFPSTQQISITGPDDTITPVDDTGAYIALATAAAQTAANASLTSIDTKLTNPLPVSGTVTANTGLAQPLTDAQLRATPVPVSGTLATTPSGTQDVNIVSSVELEIKNDAGNPVPVSGTVTANTGLSQPLTDTQLRASAVPVDGSGVTQPVVQRDQTTTGALGALNDTFDIDCTNLAVLQFDISGTYVGEISFYLSLDNVYFQMAYAFDGSSPSSLPVGSTTFESMFKLDTTGWSTCRLKMTSYTSGSVVITTIGSKHSSIIDGILNIVQVSGTTTLVDYPPGQATMAASLPVAIAVDQNSLSINGDVTIVNANGAAAVNIQDGGNSITVDGTVTANAGSNLNTSLLALDSTVAKDDSLTTLNTSVNSLLKPANTLTAVTTVGTITNVVHVDDNGGSLTIDNSNLDVALSTRLKPADTLAAVTTVGTITNPVAVTQTKGAVTDRSGTATSASVQIMAANAARRYLFIQNLGNAPIYFNFTSAATVGAGSLELSQFASFSMEGSFVSTEAINIIRSGGSNLVFTAKEG